MSLNTGSLLTAALVFFGQAASHMIMQQPVPFGNDTLNNSPLVNAKPGSPSSDFPCKQRPGVYDIISMNNVAVGSPVELKFSGSASHGGGTCQIAVSLDKEPTVKSVWKIVQVYEGGCPTGGEDNNGSDKFTFQIPEGFPNGRFTLSWTWYNKIGNREVYQNCAPIQVTGGSETKDVYESLPNLYLINLPTSECSTVETTDLEIPSPGQSLLKDSSVLEGAIGPNCAASAAAQTIGTPGSQTGAPQGDGSSSEAASATAPGYGGIALPTTSNAGSYASPTTMMTIVSSEASVPQSSAATEVPVSYPTLIPSSGAGISGPASASKSAPAPLATGSSYGGSASPGNSSWGIASSYGGSPSPDSMPESGAGSSLGGASATETASSSGTSCTTDGAVICNGGSQFGLCNHGKVIFQAVAAGTTCSNGHIQKRHVVHRHKRGSLCSFRPSLSRSRC